MSGAVYSSRMAAQRPVTGNAISRYSGAVGPYRDATATEVLEAPTRDGLARLEVGPRHILLQVGEHTKLSVTEGFVTLSRRPRRRRRRQGKPRSLRLEGSRLMAARSFPSEELGIWHEGEPGMVERLLGIRPPELLDDQALAAWHDMDRLARRLRGALRPLAGGVRNALEVGHGADRVLITDLGDRLVFHVRRLFRERARRVMEVHHDGTVVLATKHGDRRLRCTSRYGVTAIGDYIRFADPTGADLGTMSIPWISPEDRWHLVRLIGATIDPQPSQK